MYKVIFVFLALARIIIVLLCSFRSVVVAQDLDQDRLDDSMEQMLIERHAPHLYFDHREDDWPASVTWYIQHCDLVFRESDGSHTKVLPEVYLRMHPMAILEVSREGIPSTHALYGGRSPWRLDLNNHGPGESGQKLTNVGIYAHCFPSGSSEILIEYWQFLPFSDSQVCCDIGDHEADWLRLDVYLENQAPHTLRRLVYHHHGDSHCSPTTLSGPSLPADGIPQCYLEEGSHEWWPWPSANGGECCWEPTNTFCNEGHDGRGPNYRTSGVVNLGELNAPMPNDEARLVMLFNGKWGKWGGPKADSPYGPPDAADFGIPSPNLPDLSGENCLGRRTLVVVNESSSALKVYAAYRTRFPDGTWAWSNLDFQTFWRIERGQRTHLRDGQSAEGKPWIINADRIRIWATSEDDSRNWLRDKGVDVIIGDGPPERVAGEYEYRFTD